MECPVSGNLEMAWKRCLAPVLGETAGAVPWQFADGKQGKRTQRTSDESELCFVTASMGPENVNRCRFVYPFLHRKGNYSPGHLKNSTRRLEKESRLGKQLCCQLDFLFELSIGTERGKFL